MSRIPGVEDLDCVMIVSTLLHPFALAMLWLAIIHNQVTLWQVTVPILCGISQTALLNQVPNHCISFLP